MWPQKWYASASPGATREPTVFVPAIAIRPALTRPRKPRREVPAGAPVPASRLRSGRNAPPRCRREDRLELGRGVEGPLGEHGAVRVERYRERAAGDIGRRPGVRVARLVEFPHH